MSPTLLKVPDGIHFKLTPVAPRFAPSRNQKRDVRLRNCRISSCVSQKISFKKFMCDVKDKNVLSHTPLLDLPPYIPLASGEGYSNIKFEEGAEFVFSIEPEGEGKEVRVWDVKIVKIGLAGDYIHVGGDESEDWTEKPYVQIKYLTGEEGGERLWWLLRCRRHHSVRATIDGHGGKLVSAIPECRTQRQQKGCGLRMY